MPTTRTTGPLRPTTTTRRTATLSSRSSHIADKEHVTIDEVFGAYFDCRKHKRSKRSSVEYEMNYELNNYQLYLDLNNMTYRPTTSIAFCVTVPKLREVFAANFRDRVVHHLLIRKINPFIEARLTDAAFACRKGKGTLYGIEKAKDMMRGIGWYAKCDIEGFFMSIDKAILMQLVREVVKDGIKEDTDWWLWLAETVVMHRPERDCEIHGNARLWDGLPDNKTLFRTDGRGVPIGNLPSQVLANLYLSGLDNLLIRMLGEENYARGVDDFIFANEDKKKVLNAIHAARDYLRTERRLTLHPRKVTIQRKERGVLFIGKFIKGGIIHPGRRMRGNALKVCKRWSTKGEHAESERISLRDSFNSYCGLFKHTASYRLRRKMWRSLGNYKGLFCVNYNKIQTIKIKSV